MDLGLKFELQEWRVGDGGATPGSTMRPHWRTQFIYETADKAIEGRNRFTKPGRKYRVVAVMRAVVK